MNSKPFSPHTPEMMFEIEVSAKEASLIKILRRYHFGKFIIHKANNLLIRAEISDSQIINEKTGLDLAIKKL